MPLVNIQDKFTVKVGAGGGISAPSTPLITSKTSSGFTASWDAVANAIGYRLDVATDSGFTSFVTGYNSKAVSGTSEVVTGLSQNTTYYVRVRAVAASSNSSASSETTNVLTLLNPGLLSGLLAFYKLDDTTDASGNGNALTNNGSVSFSSGKIGNAAAFNGNNSNYLSESNSLGAITANGFSFAGWFYRNSSGNMVPMSSETADQNGWFLAMNSDNNIYFLAGTGSWSKFDTVGTFNNGEWFHVAASFDNTGYSKYYVNGQLTTESSGLVWTPANLTIGRNIIDGTSFDGLIDAVGIWNRTLTSGEVSDLYNSGSGLE